MGTGLELGLLCKGHGAIQSVTSSVTHLGLSILLSHSVRQLSCWISSHPHAVTQELLILLLFGGYTQRYSGAILGSVLRNDSC